MNYFTFIIPLILANFIAARIISVFLHEIGHAIPALIFTKEKVTIYLGTYGNTKHSLLLTFSKRFAICFRINIFKWNKGMVMHTPVQNSFYKKLTILIMGPMMSLIVAICALCVTFNFDLNGFLKLFSIIFFCSALFDLRNIYPSKKPVILDNGLITYCDGYQIIRLIKFRKGQENLFLAYDFYNNARYADALVLFENLNPVFINEDTLSLIIISYLQLKQHSKAKEFYSPFINKPEFKLDSDALCNIGLVESFLDDNETAMRYYNQSLELNENNIYALGNRAYTFNLYEEYNKALIDFDKALNIDPKFAYAHANRAYTKIKLKLFDDALIDINTALSLNNKEPYAYTNFGLYYFEKGEYNKAMEQFKIAYDLDSNTHMLSQYIKITNDKLTELV